VRRVEFEQLAAAELRPLVSFARRLDLAREDAEDAAARALVKLTRHYRRLRSDQARSWLYTVCRHEAYAVARQRHAHLSVDPTAVSQIVDPRNVLAEVPDRLALADALRALKPAERTALSDLALGFSYREMAQRHRWTYTKVNRCVHEGRAAVRAAVAAPSHVDS
jgi:RNA polymerase sigma-70 factor (ECF subfamily)